MQKMYTPARIAAIFIVLAMILTVYVSALYNVQVFQPRQFAQEDIHARIVRRTTTIAAARGNIYDRNGVLLASGRPAHNIKLDFGALRGMPETNDVVLELVYAAIDEGIPYTDTFPVTRGAPFEYTSMTPTQRNRLDAYFDYHRINPEIEVADLLAWFRDHYRIDYTVGILDQRLIIGVRYELEIRAIVGSITPYIFAADVSTDFISYLAERNLIGVYSETDYIREYHTTHAPHILGYIGLMNEEEYAYYKELGYPMTARVGKVGVEYAFEEYLHGSEGERVTLLNEAGTVLSDEITVQPKPGRHVYLTIDLDLQIAAENALRSTIDSINTGRRTEYDLKALEGRLDDDEELELSPAGAVVVTNANTGEVLACVSYPGFNLSTLSQDWPFLNTDPSNPMLNRATHGRYSPGSTFKMVTALAGLRYLSAYDFYTGERNTSDYNFYNRNYGIFDEGIFDKYAGPTGEGFTASCWIWRDSYHMQTHEMLDLRGALECSCNYYFLQLADWLVMAYGATDSTPYLDEASLAFGLGAKTGIELPEFAGFLANPEVKRATNISGSEAEWYSADVLLAGFGQGVHRFTPLQLANYAATIGNGGTLRELSMLRRVVSADFSETLLERSPQIISRIEDTNNLDAIREGMRSVVTGRSGTANREFGNYPVAVAAKTGTVQSATTRMNDGVFVCYAPADNPEIAISVVVEKGGSGAGINVVARMIMDRYFASESSFTATPYGQMIP